MLAKVLMCPYFPENFKPNEENKHLKKRIQFYWKYGNKHEFFVFACKGHPFLCPRLIFVFRLGIY